MSGDFQRFSAIQYYLGHAQNTVHVVLEVPRTLTEDAFQSLVEQVVASAPHLLWRESLEHSGHFRDAQADWRGQCAFVSVPTALDAARDLAARLAAPLHDTGRPAFRAICQQIDEGTTRIIFQTTHALMEGGDVSDLLRGRTSDIGHRPTVGAGLSLAARIGVWALIPAIWILHVSIAAMERKRRSDFAFARITLDRADLRRVAKSLGLSQSDLIFALCSHHRGQVPKRKKKLYVAYSSRPPQRVHLCDDEMLDVRIDEIWVNNTPDFTSFAKRMAAALRKRGKNPMFVQTWQRRINQVHRILHRRLPWLYPQALFGYAPYDVVLSLLPPVQPGRTFEVLKDAAVFAGSDTGTAESCIFAASDASVSVTLWSGPNRATHVETTLAEAKRLGIGAMVWE